MPGLISLTAFVFVAGVDAPGQTLDIAAIQRAIELRGAEWIAGPNWVTELTRAERQRLMGWDMASEPQPVHRTPPGVPQDQPPYLDWRDYEGQNYVTPVKDQRRCGSCWAFGSLGAMESRLAIDGGVSDPALDLSEQYLVSCATDHGCDGHSIQGALGYVQYNGVVDEQCMLYEASDAIPCEDHCTDSEYRFWYLQTWSGTGGTVEGMKAALMQGPVAVGFIVYSDFDTYSSGVYEHVWGEEEGQHAVMVVGWDDTLSCWICKNSWGPSWGEQGYFRIRWGQCNLEPWSFWLTPASQPYPRLALSGYDISSDEGDGDLVANPGEEVAFAATLRNLPLWHDATDVSAQLASVGAGVEVTVAGGLFGDVASGEDTANTGSPFSVRIDDGQPLGDVSLELHCSSAEGGAEPYRVVIPLDFRISWDQRGWPVELGCAVTSSPLIVTLEDERGPAVVFGDEAGLLHVMAPEGGELPGFPLDVGDQVKGAVAVGDVDGDGGLELVLGTRSSEVWAVNPDGTVLFTLAAPGRIYATPALGDIDQDGLPDAVVGTINGSLLAVRWDGTQASGFPVDLGEQVAAGVALADLDGDRSLEIIVGTLSSQIHVLGSDGTEWPGWPRAVSGKVWAGPTVADLDGDGRWELLVGTQAGMLHALGAAGERWVADVGSWIRTSPGVADLDDDGRLDVLVGCDSGYVYAVDADGGTAPGAWPAALGARIETSPVVADFDGDGAPEVVSGTTDGELWILDAVGRVVAPFPAPVGSAVRSSPCVGDVDTDGDLEIAVGTATNAWVVDFKATGGTTEGYWSVFRGGAARGGVWGEGFITPASDVATGDFPDSYRLLPPAPNPTRGEMALSFDMPRPAWVNVTVFNPAGQAVSALHEGFLPAGRHRLVWPTRSVAPGRYVYRLQSPDYVGTGAVVIAR